MISTTESMDFWTAWSLIEPVAVIKFNDINSHPGTRML